jgi:hypothetical protein
MTTEAPPQTETTAPPPQLPPQPPAAVERMTILQKLVKNKILLGLLIVFFFVMTVGQFYSKEDKTPPAAHTAHSATHANGTTHLAGAVPMPTPLDPELARQFVSWWITKSMDYGATTAAKSHADAFAWMTPQATQAFQQTFWTPDIAGGVTQGRINAAFQPIQVQAEARNPDGTVVVGVSGTLVAQESTSPTPETQQIVCDFLVKKEKDGLRISGLYNRTGGR